MLDWIGRHKFRPAHCPDSQITWHGTTAVVQVLQAAAGSVGRRPLSRAAAAHGHLLGLSEACMNNARFMRLQEALQTAAGIAGRRPPSWATAVHRRLFRRRPAGGVPPAAGGAAGGAGGGRRLRPGGSFGAPSHHCSRPGILLRARASFSSMHARTHGGPACWAGSGGGF